ncbi:MAG: ATPase [Marinilabiliales bacterium]|nr:MAG: ATPase [Marinilabiliales bacterium]
MLYKNRISITGPESCGKSVLSVELAKHYDTKFVKEVSRSYLEGKANYSYSDIINIAKLQLKSEEANAKENNGLLFCDTDILVNKIWINYVYNKIDKWIEDNFLQHEYGLYLLCYPDLEWQYDPLRENPNNREELFVLYESELKSAGFNYKIVKGQGEKRLQNAFNIIDGYLKKHE